MKYVVAFIVSVPAIVFLLFIFVFNCRSGWSNKSDLGAEVIGAMTGDRILLADTTIPDRLQVVRFDNNLQPQLSTIPKPANTTIRSAIFVDGNNGIILAVVNFWGDYRNTLSGLHIINIASGRSRLITLLQELGSPYSDFQIASASQDGKDLHIYVNDATDGIVRKIIYDYYSHEVLQNFVVASADKQGRRCVYVGAGIAIVLDQSGNIVSYGPLGDHFAPSSRDVYGKYLGSGETGIVWLQRGDRAVAVNIAESPPVLLQDVAYLGHGRVVGSPSGMYFIYGNGNNYANCFQLHVNSSYYQFSNQGIKPFAITRDRR